MRVNQSTCEVIHDQRQTAKNVIVESETVAPATVPRLGFDCKPEVFDRFFFGSPGKFKPPQSLIRCLGSAEMQHFHSFCRQMPDPFPHHEIVGPYIPKPFVRRTELVNRFVARMKKNGGSNWFPT